MPLVTASQTKRSLHFAIGGFLIVGAASCISCRSTIDHFADVREGATKQEVLDLLGEPDPDPPPNVAEPPAGCASHLVYRDEYDAAAMRWLHEKVHQCGGMWLHVCFDEEGRVKEGLRATVITC